MTEFLRMSGIYWGATCLDIMGQLEQLDKKSIIEFIKKCQCQQSGGISACDGHDAHILYTLSAIQVLDYTESTFQLLQSIYLPDSLHLQRTARDRY